MINVTIFALPLSSTIVMFSGLTGATFVAFWDYSGLNSLVETGWLITEALIWVLSPIVAICLTYGL